MTSRKILSQSVPVQVEGYYLVRQPAGEGPWPLLIGFHGYGETAEIQMERLEAIPGTKNWLLASVEGLNHFYPKNHNAAGASWMTSRRREQAIQQNMDYVDGVVESLIRQYATPDTLVYAGFSQGAAMAARAAVLCKSGCSGLVMMGGDVPEELNAAQLSDIGSCMLARGKKDRAFSAERMKADAERMRKAGAQVRCETVEGGHGWPEEFGKIVGEYLETLWERELKDAPANADLGAHEKQE
ncbi:MAG: alpha/beta hydrolase [Candidatus Sumerlaeia bacterium]